MAIDDINFLSLKPFNGKSTHSFEQLIYQLAKRKYGHLGTFTPIDGSGGDGGVEFYLTLKNGDVWGWQCKYYEDRGRLSDSGRFKKIEQSLAVSCSNYPRLIKWILSLKTDLTVDVTVKGGKVKTGERSWFENELKFSVPNGRSVDLGFWGETDILEELQKPTNIGITSFFFGGLELDSDWFQRRGRLILEKLKDKYDPELHTMGLYEQSIVDCMLLNPHYIEIIDDFKTELHDLKAKVKSSINEYREESKEDHRAKTYLACFDELKPYLDYPDDILDEIIICVKRLDAERIGQVSVWQNDHPYHKILRDMNECYSDRVSYSAIRNFFKRFEQIVRNYVHPVSRDLYFVGGAAIGKTHLCCDIVHHRMANGLPSLCVTGDMFNNSNNIEDTLKNIFDVPPNYSFEVFLSALDTYGKINNTYVPIIIDGLNETVFDRYFSTLWNTHLPTFAAKIRSYDNLRLICTVRKSYVDEIWDNPSKINLHHLSGFDDLEVTREAVEKYFKKYRIVTHWTFANLYRFSRPIFLKIYCEIKNADWESGKEVEVNLSTDTNDDLFSTYFQQINSRVTRKAHFLRAEKPFIVPLLDKLASFFWANNLREIDADSYFRMMDGDNYDSAESKGDILLHEGLIMSRDIRSGKEFMFITYEIMAAYLVAKHLVNTRPLAFFAPDGEFYDKIAEDSGQQHPLYENIIEEVALLFPTALGAKLHMLYASNTDDLVYRKSVKVLWHLDGKLIDNDDIAHVELMFGDQAFRERVIPQFRYTLVDTYHPFNALSLSRYLFGLSVPERDLSWTEYVRHRAHELELYIEEFNEGVLRSSKDRNVSSQKFHLAAHYIQFILTSTNRKLRDTATKALYRYACSYLEEFAEMTYKSLRLNDPYVPERMLAALYGACLARERACTDPNSRPILMVVGRKIFDLMFSANAEFFTTHWLMRDFAFNIVKLAVSSFPQMLEKNEREYIVSPFLLGKRKKYKIYKGKDPLYQAPLSMDFSNYTIGYIVEGGTSYSNPPEKTKVRKQIYQRILDLGWNEEDFLALDKSVSNSNLHQNRSERPNVERYGKKYSWIAYHEVAGHREDKGMIKNEWEDYRSSDIDIDPSFPVPIITDSIVEHDFLGDRSETLAQWIADNEAPDVGTYLYLDKDGVKWVCLDGYFGQKDKANFREIFIFPRGILVKKEEYGEFMKFFRKKSIGSRWIPEIRQNHYTFGAEIYLFPEATASNKNIIAFQIGKETKTYAVGEEGYFPEISVDPVTFAINQYFPPERTVETAIERKFEVLIPVMEYSWESYHSDLNPASHNTILSKEIAFELGLNQKPESFDLVDRAGKLAVLNIDFTEDENNRHRMTYLRKDLLDQYLKSSGFRLVWGIWGEREIRSDMEPFKYVKFQRKLSYRK